MAKLRLVPKGTARKGRRIKVIKKKPVSKFIERIKRRRGGFKRV